MKKSLILFFSLALVLVCSVALLATGAFAEEQEITISYAKAHDTTDTTTKLDTVAYEGGCQTVKAGESFTLPTTADISQLSEEGYVLVWYTQDGRTYNAGQSVSFDKDTKLFRAAAKKVNNITDLNNAMTSGSTCAILTADINTETTIWVYGQGASTLFLNGFNITVSTNNNIMGGQRSGKHILGEGTVNITNPNKKIGEYAVFQCQSHGYNGSANKTVIGRDVTINAPNFYLAVDGDGSFNNHYPWVRVYGAVNVYGMFKMTNGGSRSPFMEIFDTATVTINGPFLSYDRGWDGKKTVVNYQGFEYRIYGGTFNLPAEASSVDFWTYDHMETLVVTENGKEVTYTVNETNEIYKDTIKIFGGSFTLANGAKPAIDDYITEDYIGSIPSGGNGLRSNSNTSTYHVAYLTRPGYNLEFTVYSADALGTLKVTDYVDGSLSGTYKYTATTKTVGTITNYIDTITVYEEDGVTVTDKFALGFMGDTVTFTKPSFAADMKLEENNGTYLAVPVGCEHEYTVNQVAPTCSSVGYTEYICNKCGYSSKVLSDEKGEHTFEVKEYIAPVGTNYGSKTVECTVCKSSVTYVCSLDPESIETNVTVRKDDGTFESITVFASDVFEFSRIGGEGAYLYTITGIKSFGEYSIRNIYGVEIPVGIPFVNITIENNEKYENESYGLNILSFADGVDVQITQIGLLRNLKEIKIGNSTVEFTNGSGYKTGARLPLTSIDMSKSGANVKIGSSVFEAISTLTELKLGDGCTYSFGSYSFKNSKVEELYFSATSTYSFSNNAFEGTSLTSLEFPDGLNLSFGDGCFYNCKSLASVKFGENATYTIGGNGFRNTALTELVLAKNSTYTFNYQVFMHKGFEKLDASAPGINLTLGQSAFNVKVGNEYLPCPKFIMGEGNTYLFHKECFANTSFESFTLVANSTYDIREYCFSGNAALTTFDASASGVTVIFNGSCFRDRAAFTTLKLGENSTYTFKGDFARATSLANIEFKENSSYFFENGCIRGSLITSLTLAPNSSYTFRSWCIGESAIETIDASLGYITLTVEGSGMRNAKSFATLIIGPYSTCTFGGECLRDTVLSSFTVGANSSYTFSSSAFYGTQIKEFVLADDSTYVFNNSAFNGCETIEMLDMSADNSTITVNANAFKNRKTLKTLILNGKNSTYVLKSEAFNTTLISEIVLGEGSSYLFEQHAFAGNTLLSIDASAKDITAVYNSHSFRGLSKLTVFDISGENGNHTFHSESFYGTGIKKLAFGDNSTYVFKGNTFNGSSTIEELDFSASNVTATFETNSFSHRGSIKTLKFGENSTYSIASYAFYKATHDEGASGIVFAGTSTFDIGKEAFRECDFESIVFEDNCNVKFSDTGAFHECNKATYLYIGKNIAIEKYPFKNMKKLDKLVIMDGVTIDNSEYCFERAGSSDFATPFVVFNHSTDFVYNKGTFNECDGIILYTLAPITRNDVFPNCTNGNGYVGYTVVMGIPHTLQQGERAPTCTLTGGVIWVGLNCDCDYVVDTELLVNVYENKSPIDESTQYARQEFYPINPIPALGHTKGEFIAITYSNGYTHTGIASYDCTVCDNNGDYEEIVNAIFASYGYSVCEFDKGIVQSFFIDSQAYAAYKSFNKDFTFGLVASGNTSGEAIKPLEINDGRVVATNNALVIPQDTYPLDYLEFKVKNISDNTADKLIIFCAYVYDGNSINYIDNNTYSDTVTGVSYNSLLTPVE